MRTITYSTVTGQKLAKSLESKVLNYFMENGKLPEAFLNLLETFIDKIVEEDLDLILNSDYDLSNNLIFVKMRDFDEEYCYYVLSSIDPILSNKVFDLYPVFCDQIATNILNEDLFNILYEHMVSYYEKHFHKKISESDFDVFSTTNNIYILSSDTGKERIASNVSGNFLILKRKTNQENSGN